MESKREQNKRLCQERILKTSMRLFRAHGFEETLISDVAKKAGISRATLYNYFPSKESLLLGIAQKEIDRVQKEVRGKLKGLGAKDKLYQAMLVFVHDSFSFIAISRKILLMNAERDSYLYSTRLAMLELFGQLVEEGRAAGYLSGDIDAGRIVELLHGLYVTTQFCWLDSADLSEQACAERLFPMMDLFLAGVAQG